MRPKRKRFVEVLVASLLVLSCGGSAVSNPEDPNVLIIMLDQWRYSAYGAAGSSNVKTPAMDSIAAQGMRFTHYTTPEPVCSATRVMMNASVWPHTYGNKLKPGTATLYSELSKAGYTNGFVGKWHMTPRSLSAATNPKQFVPPEIRRDIHWFAGQEHAHDYYEDAVYFLGDDPTPRSAADYEPAHQTELANQFITEEAEKGSKFFLTVSFGPPHDPYDARGWATDPDTIALRSNVPTAAHNDARRVLAEYFGMLNRLDVQIQALLDTLERTGLADNTIVILTSDHGAMLHSQGEVLKRKPWEESIRVPFAVRWPRGGIRAGGTSPALMASIDVMPTVLGLVGRPVPEKLAGIDHSPLMLGKPFEPRSSIYIGISRANQNTPFEQEWRGVRTADGWTYATSLGKTDWLLYNNNTDPQQRNSLIDHPDYQEKKAELDALTRHWALVTQDRYTFP